MPPRELNSVTALKKRKETFSLPWNVHHAPKSTSKFLVLPFDMATSTFKIANTHNLELVENTMEKQTNSINLASNGLIKLIKQYPKIKELVQEINSLPNIKLIFSSEK